MMLGIWCLIIVFCIPLLFVCAENNEHYEEKVRQKKIKRISKRKGHH